MTSRRILALATTAFLALGGVALADSTAATTSTATTTTTTTKTLPSGLVGTAKSFKVTDSKTVSVEGPKGAWYDVDLTKDCTPLASAKTIRIARSKKTGHIGSVVVGKTYCSISSFSEASAPPATSQ